MPLAAPRWNYFVSPDTTPVRKDHVRWSALIPLSRRQAGRPESPGATTCLTYGDYFVTARDFLRQNKYEMLSGALSQHLEKNIKPEDIRKINVCIEKHGEFYHPARIDIALPDSNTSLVLNMAVSKSGTTCILKEYELLKRLGQKFPFSYVPKVYYQGRTNIKDHRQCYMFLGEWFDGFHEFHISMDLQDNKHKIVVWDPDKGPFFLSTDQMLALYKQAAKILTLYFNVETFEQIFPWHHAAGDFVLRRINDQVEIKLISVRNYISMIEANEIDDNNRDINFLLNALLIFFLNLTIRMRLDRLDGIGDIVWADDTAVEGTVQGFFEGLALKSPVAELPDTLANCFQAYLLVLTQNDLVDLCLTLADAYNPKAPEVHVVKRHLNEHVNSLLKAIQLMIPKK